MGPTVVWLIGRLKGSLLKAFVKQNKTALFPAKHLHTVARTVNENEYIPAHGIHAQLFGYQTA